VLFSGHMPCPWPEKGQKEGGCFWDGVDKFVSRESQGGRDLHNQLLFFNDRTLMSHKGHLASS
jgi:hypothetical protein